MICIHIILMIFGLIDVVAGLSLTLRISTPVLLAYTMLIKGGWSVVTSFPNDFIFTLLGVIDLLSGLGLLFNVSTGFFFVIGLATLVKGAWSLINSFI